MQKSKISLWRHTSIKILYFSKKNFFSLSLWWAGDIMGKHTNTFFSQSFFSLCCVVIYYPRGFSQSTPPKTTKKLMKKWCVLSFIHCGILQ
jgi:hypothetical protein